MIKEKNSISSCYLRVGLLYKYYHIHYQYGFQLLIKLLVAV